MNEIQSYRDLVVWQKAMTLAEEVYKITSGFPDSQRYVLVTQLQRCAVSVPSNIAEGRSRHSENDFIYHLNIARGSLAELETQAILSQRLNFMDEVALQRILNLATEVRKMLFGLRSSLRTPIKNAETSNL